MPMPHQAGQMDWKFHLFHLLAKQALQQSLDKPDTTAQEHMHKEQWVNFNPSRLPKRTMWHWESQHTPR